MAHSYKIWTHIQGATWYWPKDHPVLIIYATLPDIYYTVYCALTKPNKKQELQIRFSQQFFCGSDSIWGKPPIKHPVYLYIPNPLFYPNDCKILEEGMTVILFTIFYVIK